MLRSDTTKPDVSPREVYTHGYSPTVQANMAARTAKGCAGFLLPHLRPNMRLLDCGCGPGSTTVDLAELLAPGHVVGIDLEPSQVAAARARAAERNVTNVAFEVGNVYDLPFPAASFDAVVGHTIVQHLRDPLRALREMHRVLAPGGVIGLRDDDWDSFILEPSSPALDLVLSLYGRVWSHNGGDPIFARKHRRMLREAGFVQTRSSARIYSAGSREEVNWWTQFANFLLDHNQQPAFVRVVVENGWADPATLEATYEALRVWSQSDDAFGATTWIETVAWKPDVGQ